MKSTSDLNKKLRAYAKRIAKNGNLEELRVQESDRESMRGSALEGMYLDEQGNEVDQEIELANNGVKKLIQDEELTHEEFGALEAIVMPKERPVTEIINDSFGNLPAPWSHFSNEDSQIRTHIEDAIPSIGRINIPEILMYPYAGTGFVVGKDLLMTNRHVAALFTKGVGKQKLNFFSKAEVNFKHEINNPGSSQLEVLDVVMIHPWWDMAILKVNGLNEKQDPLTLSHSSPEDLQGQDVAVVGYPAKDPRNNEALQDQIFKKKYNIKRLQPGKLWERRNIRSFKNIVSAVTHDSSTLGGNSGSAVIKASSGEVIGLHFAGRYLDANFAVPTYELARDPRVVDTGINFSGSVPPTSDWDFIWNQADGNEGPSIYKAADLTNLQTPVSSPSVQSEISDGRNVTFKIPLSTQPLNITISVGESSIRKEVLLPGKEKVLTDIDEEITDDLIEKPMSIDPDRDYSNRTGYQKDFLGSRHKVDLPWLSESLFADVAFNEEATQERHLLKYNHFSLVMSRSRRVCFYSAVNIDGSKEKQLERDLFNDKWFVDPRISRQFQYENDAYAKNPLDRGHVVRRLDPVWGNTFKEAKSGHDDTFHWTNCSPQHKDFNRNRKTWGLIENYILNHTNNKNVKVSVFTGPVFKDDDPILITHSGTEVQIPLKFWKIVAMVNQEDQLTSTAFLISQEEIINAYFSTLEFPVSKEVKGFQVPITEIESLTDLSFDNLSNFDSYVSSEESLSGVTKKEISQLEDICL